jgi:hypothetical protein
MALTGLAYQLGAYSRTAVDTAQTVAFTRNTSAIILSAEAQNVRVTFDGTTPTSTNGILIISGAQPVTLPIGYSANGIKGLGAAAGGFLHVQQLA